MQQMSITVTCPTHHAATVGQQITMSSREIAKLVDSRHSNVCVTIERLMNSGVIGGYAALQYTHPQNGQTYHHYEVNKRDSYVIVAQLSPEFTAPDKLRVQSVPLHRQRGSLDWWSVGRAYC